MIPSDIAINQKPGVRGFIVHNYNTVPLTASIVNPDTGYRGRGADPIMYRWVRLRSLPGLLRGYLVVDLFLELLSAQLPLLDGIRGHSAGHAVELPASGGGAS